jgi:hypothetical protein
MRILLIALTMIAFSARASIHETFLDESPRTINPSSLLYRSPGAGQAVNPVLQCPGRTVSACTIRSGQSTCACTSLDIIDPVSRDQRIQMRGGNEQLGIRDRY